MSHDPKKAEKEMKKAIFISADCWLEVFDLLPRSQLGFGIAMISHRFDYYVDEHFKTRKWTLEHIVIQHKIGQNGAKEMEIVNSSNWESLPIPQKPLPKKVVGIGSIKINFFDQNVLTFLGRFDRFFASCSTMLDILTVNVRISEFVVLTIWPMFKDAIHVMYLNSIIFRQMRQLAPSMLNDFQSLRVVNFYDVIVPEFPPDDSANASDGQAMAKWLFSSRSDNLPKQLIVIYNSAVEQQWLETVQQIKEAFSIASSPVAFIICVVFPPSDPFSAVMPFELSNELTGEKLELSQKTIEIAHVFKLIRCPIASAVDEEKWKKEMKEFAARKNNKINIFIRDDGVDNGLLHASANPSDDQKQ